MSGSPVGLVSVCIREKSETKGNSDKLNSKAGLLWGILLVNAISQKYRRLFKLFCLCGMYDDIVGKVSQTETIMDTGIKKNDNMAGINSEQDENDNQQQDDRHDLTWASHPVMTL